MYHSARKLSTCFKTGFGRISAYYCSLSLIIIFFTTFLLKLRLISDAAPNSFAPYYRKTTFKNASFMITHGRPGYSAQVFLPLVPDGFRPESVAHPESVPDSLRHPDPAAGPPRAV
jgi:hypothetical protein